MKSWRKRGLGQEQSKCPELVLFETLKRSQSCSRKEKGVGSSWRGLKAQVLRVLYAGVVRNLDFTTSELGSHWRV